MPALSSLLSLAIAAVAPAQGYPARDVGGWTVAASRDGTGCFATKTYAGSGETVVLLGLDTKGKNHLSVLNANWSIASGDRLKLDFRLTSGGYPGQSAVGMMSEGKRGFVTEFDAKFPTHFAASKSLHIYRGKVPVEQLSLAGSGAAVAEMRRCVAVQAGKPDSAGRGTAIPRDPFANDVEK